jgi:hypothetical protein
VPEHKPLIPTHQTHPKQTKLQIINQKLNNKKKNVTEAAKRNRNQKEATMGFIQSLSVGGEAGEAEK